jgi:ADP-heptose:LPS heptosyltransferase
MVRVCFYRGGAIGDVLHTLPAVRSLRKHMGSEAHLTYLTSPVMAELLEASPDLDRTLACDPRSSLPALLREGWRLRGAFDEFVDLQPSLRSLALSLTAAAPVRRTYRKHRSGTQGLHAWQDFASSYFAALPELNLASEDSLLQVSRDSRGLDQYRPLVAVIPGVGAARPERAWPKEHWLRLLEMLPSDRYRAVAVGGEEEMALGSWLAKEHAHLTNLCGALSLPETASLLAACRLAIGADTGPTHLAGAVGTPTIGLFGPTSAVRHAPFTGTYVQAPEASMRNLSPEQVYLLVGEWLA